MLARWSSWGAILQVFDKRRDDWARERKQLRSVLTDAKRTAARRTTINAHYTDPAYVAAMWSAMQRLGVEGRRVRERYPASR